MKKFLIFLGLLFFITGCSSQNSGNYYSDDYYTEEGGEEVEINNPYDEGSGHSAGYNWAEETGGGCSGNSDSFNEGCEECYRQNSGD